MKETLNNSDKAFMRIALITIVIGLLMAAFGIMSSCTPVSRKEGDRIMRNYNQFNNQVRGYPVRKVR